MIRKKGADIAAPSNVAASAGGVAESGIYSVGPEGLTELPLPLPADLLSGERIVTTGMIEDLIDPRREDSNEKAARRDDLGRTARHHHLLFCQHAATAFQHLLVAGEALIEAKKIVGHGGFGQFLGDHGIPKRSARVYMQAARARREGQGFDSIAGMLRMTRPAAQSFLADDLERMNTAITAGDPNGAKVQRSAIISTPGDEVLPPGVVPYAGDPARDLPPGAIEGAVAPDRPLAAPYPGGATSARDGLAPGAGLKEALDAARPTGLDDRMTGMKARRVAGILVNYCSKVVADFGDFGPEDLLALATQIKASDEFDSTGDESHVQWTLVERAAKILADLVLTRG